MPKAVVEELCGGRVELFNLPRRQHRGGCNEWHDGLRVSLVDVACDRNRVGIAGWIGALWEISLPIARIVHVFVAANVGSFLGSLAYVCGVAAVRWRKVD